MIMNTKIMPLGKNVLIKIATPETKTASGIFIPETASNERPQQGVVEAIGNSEEITVKKGQKVMFKKYSGEEFSIDGKNYVIVKAKEIIAVIE